MRIAKWMLALIALLACGLIAVGCGDDDDDSSSDTAVDADAFLAECEDAVAGTPAEETAATVCQQAADALESCGEQAEAAGGDDDVVAQAVEACQATADAAVEQLEAANP